MRKAAQATERRDAARAGNTPGAAEKPAEGTQESHTARNKDPRKLDTFRKRHGRSAYNLKQLRQMETAGGPAPPAKNTTCSE